MKKNISLLLFLALTAVLGSGYLKIGAKVPEFGKGVWSKNNKITVASVRGKKMLAILFWKPDHSSVRAMQNFSRYAHKKPAPPVAFAAVASGSLQNILKFPLLPQLGRIPLLVDTHSENFKLFLRPENRLPMAVLIGKDGKLLWRGEPRRLPLIVTTVQKGQYNAKKVIGDDNFNAAFTAMITKNNYKGALQLLEKELDRPGTNPKEIVSLQVGIHYRRLNSAANAVAAIHRAQKRYPGVPAFYEMELKMLELGHMEKKMGEFYFRLTSVFKNQPRVLLKFVTAELNRPFSSMNPRSVYTVARAAANAGKYANKREKGRAMLYYAQSLYCLGRVDLAANVARRSLKFLKGEKEFKQASELSAYYGKLLAFSSQIKE